jgi:putative copper resistance protein D
MRWLIEIYGFLSVVIRAISLASEAMTVGGIVFLSFCLTREAGNRAAQACERLLRWAASLLAGSAALGLMLSALVLRASADDLTWPDALLTVYALSQFAIAILALFIACLARRDRSSALLLPGALLPAAALVGSHAFARVENRGLLLFVTVLHHFAMGVWIGGLPYLAATLSRGDGPASTGVIRRFSRLAFAGVLVLSVAGLAMTQGYLGGLSAMHGSSYGVMLGAKVFLLGLLVVLGTSNFKLLSRHNDPLRRVKISRIVEVEAAVGLVAIFAAASLTSQPPSIDVPEGRVTWAEIVQRFTPHMPRFRTPPLASLSPPTPLSQETAQETGVPLPYVPGAPYRPDNPADIAWSEYNHNWAGFCVLAMGILAILAQSGRAPWARHWPLGFLGLAVFLLVRADSENWPLGPRGFWESFQVADVAQHRLFVILIVLFAWFEWQVASRRAAGWRPLVFPAVCVLGGALLLTHSHPLGNVKEALLAELSHTAIALLAVTAAAARWLELRLPKSPTAFGLVWPVCFLAIGVILTFYRESS